MSEEPVPVTPSISGWKKYGKAVISAVWAAATIIIPLRSGDHAFDMNEKLIAATAIGAAIITYIVPMSPSFRSVKSAVNAILAGVAVVQTVLSNGGDFAHDPNAWMLVAAAVLGALGVKLAPAASVEQPEPVVAPSGFTD